MPPPSVAAAAKRRCGLRVRTHRRYACLVTWDEGAETARRACGRPRARPIGPASVARRIARAAIVTCAARIAL